jgi:hypothetical protein
MTDDELMAVMVKVDPLTRRIPAGIRAIAQSIEALARAQALEDAAKCAASLWMIDGQHSADEFAAAIRALPPHG